MKKTLFLVDGSSYLYRAYHAMPALTNTKGEPTGAIYGVVNMIRRLLQEYSPTHIAIVFDAKGKTFRDELYSDYKANRPSMPGDLAAQIVPLHNILRAMGLPLLIVDGVEADDVIGTLATSSTQRGWATVISTGDKDMAQLVDEHVSLVNTMTNTNMDISGVKEKFGVMPEQIVDYLTLIGDTVDNVPGVPKVGPKTAAKWLETYQTLDNLLSHADDIKGKIGENLKASFAHLPLSRELVTIKCDVILPLTLDELQLGEPDQDKLQHYFAQHEFKTWLRELLTDQNVQADSTETIAETERQPSAYETIMDEASFDVWLKRLRAADVFAFDSETTSLDYVNAEIVGVSFAIKGGHAAYIPLAHDYDNAPPQLSRDHVLQSLKPLLENTDVAKIGQNLKYDMSVLARYGIALRGIASDTMLESYILDSVATRHDLDSLALKYLGHSNITFEDVAGKGAKQITFNKVTIEQAGPYAAEDADICFRLHDVLWPQIQAIPPLLGVLNEIEVPLISVLSRMERTGVLIDAAKLRQQSVELAESIQKLEADAFADAGETFNLASPKQIQTILFDKLKIPVVKKTPTGQPSTAEDVLQELAEQYTLPKIILQHRSLSKLKSTYTDKLPEQINPTTGRIHTSYHQAVAATGRLSSSDPNLQNIPIRTEEGRKIRQAFVAQPGFKIVAADYSQIELRIMAHLSGDEGLLRAFNNGEDIHRATASEIFGVPLTDVSADQRRSAKAINFGLIYGMSAFGLAKQLDVDRTSAQQYMDHYFRRYPGVKHYMDSIREQAKSRGYVETLFGRRLYLPDIKASNMQRRQYAERTAINAPMQGTAADIIKRAMIRVDQWIREDAPGVVLVMQVHDELVFEVSEREIASAVVKIRELMTKAASLDVPLEVDVGNGANWDEAH